MADEQQRFDETARAVEEIRRPRPKRSTEEQIQRNTEATLRGTGKYQKDYAQEKQRRLTQADRTLRSRDPKGYKGTADREYQKDLARHARRDGHRALNQRTDQRIAGKLKAAGYNDKEIRQAIQKSSPMAIKNNPKHSEAYAKDVARRAQAARRAQPASGGDRRLKQLGMNEKTGLTPKQEKQVSRWKATQEHVGKNRHKKDVEQLSQGQRFRYLKATQLDQHGAKKATNPRADLEAAKAMNSGFKDSRPENSRFGKAIGRNSASVVTEKPVKTREAYGAGMARKAHKPSGGPNTKPPRQKAPTHDAKASHSQAAQMAAMKQRRGR